jgi:hypothetical protein
MRRAISPSLIAVGLGLPSLALWSPLAALSQPSASARAPAPRVDPDLLKSLRFRLVGPFRGGRVAAVSGVPTDDRTFLMGSTGGGVWKTTDGGQTWAKRDSAAVVWTAMQREGWRRLLAAVRARNAGVSSDVIDAVF